MNDGISLYQIDEMDMYYYIDLLSYKAIKEVKLQIKNMDDAGL